MPILCSSLLFFYSCYVDHRDLHSFPTRRSSDLQGRSVPPLGTTCTRRSRKSCRIRCCTGSGHRVCFIQGASPVDRKSTRLNSSHEWISYAVFCLKKKKRNGIRPPLTTWTE